MTINDSSIFVPQSSAPLSIVRCVELLRSLTHDYQTTVLNSSDFSTYQFDVRAGAITSTGGKKVTTNGNSKNVAGVQTLFSTAVTGVEGFQNFALKTDLRRNNSSYPCLFDISRLLINIPQRGPILSQHSDAALRQVIELPSNNMSGNWEYYFGILKNGVGIEVQPTGILEDVTFGRIFMEDSTGRVVGLQ